MATENILVRLGLEARDYIQGMGKAATATDGVTKAAGRVEGGVGSLTTKLGGLAKAAAATFAVGQIGSFAMDAINAFSDLEESINAVEVQFGEGAAAIKTFGETAATEVGLSNAQFNQLSVTTGALMSNFISDTGEAADATIKLTQRAADMASVFNTSVPDALNAVQAALRGESEPIRRYGVLLDEATVNARALALGLADSKSEIDQQAKGLARLDLIYEQTNKTAGDFAATSDSLANSQKTLGARFEDTKAEVGEALAPAFVALLDVAESLLPVLADMAPVVANLASATADLVTSAEPAVGVLGRLAQAVGVYATQGAVAAGLSLFTDDVQVTAIERQAEAAEELAEAQTLLAESSNLLEQERAEALLGPAEIRSQQELKAALKDLIATQFAYTDSIKATAAASGLSAKQQVDVLKDVLLTTRNVGKEQRGNLKQSLLDAAFAADLQYNEFSNLIDVYKLSGLAIGETAEATEAVEEAMIRQVFATDLTTLEQAKLIRELGLLDAALRLDVLPSALDLTSGFQDSLIPGLQDTAEAVEVTTTVINESFAQLQAEVADLLGPGIVPADLSGLTKSQLEQVAGAVSGGLGLVDAAIQGATEPIEQSFTTMFKNIKKVAEQQAAFAGIVEQAQKFGPEVVNFIKQAGPGIVGAIKRDYGGDIEKALTGVANELSAASELPGVAIVDGLVVGVTSEEEALIEGITGTVLNAADAVTTGTFEKFQESGLAAANGITLGLDENLDLTIVALNKAETFYDAFVKRMAEAGRDGAAAAVAAAAGISLPSAPSNPTNPGSNNPPPIFQDQRTPLDFASPRFNLDQPASFSSSQATSNTVQVFMDAPTGADTFDQVALALQLSGITEEIEWAGSSTVRAL